MAEKKKRKSLKDQLKLITDAVRNRKKDYNREMGPYLKKKKK